MEFEDILLDVGDNGKYQSNLILFFLVPAAALVSWLNMNIVFMLSVPEHWCYIPEVASTNLSIEQQRSLVSPSDSPSCHMYNRNYTDLLSSSTYAVENDSTTRPCTKGWQYDNTFYDYTVATQWNMVCDDAHYTSLVFALYNVGSIIGTPIYGLISDKIGRKIAFFITVAVTTVTSIASLFVTNFVAFVVIKTINGGLMPTLFQLPFIIIIELVGPEIRTRLNGIVNCAWTVGLCFLPLIAYLSRNWIVFGSVMSASTLIFYCYWRFLPESPRWLVSQERYEDAAIILFQIGETNGKPQDKTVLLQNLQKLGEKIKKEKDVDGVKNSPIDFLRYPQLRKKFLIITACWIANITAYYGLQLNVSNLAGNEFINFFLLAVVEMPGYLTSWYAMERFGRRWCAVAGFTLTGIVCMLVTIDVPFIDVVCSVIGKYLAAATFLTTYQQSSELYPTVMRTMGMGMSSTIAFVATLVVPYLIYLSVYGKAIPFIIFGIASIFAGFLASFLPETLNENLPQTIFDAEEFGRNQKFFSHNRRRQSLSRERAASFGMKIKKLGSFATHGKNDPKSDKPRPGNPTADHVESGKNGMPKPTEILQIVGSLRKRTRDYAAETVVIPPEVTAGGENICSKSTSVEMPQNVRDVAESVIRISDAECKARLQDAGNSHVGYVSYVNKILDDSDDTNDLKNECSEVGGKNI